MKSCYVFEFSVPAGSARHGHAHAYPDATEILARIPTAFGIPRDSPTASPDAYYVGLVFYGATVGIWVVQRGRFTRYIDLRPHLTLEFTDARTARLDDPDALAALEDDFNRDPSQPVTLTVDTAALRAALPPLEPPLLAPGETLDAEFAPDLEPETGTYLTAGSFDHGSWDLENGDPLDDNTDVIDTNDND